MPSISRALPANVVAVAILAAIGLSAVRIAAQGMPAPRDLAVRPDFTEPVTLASKDGVLEVTLTPRQSTASLDTVAKPVKNMLLFDYSCSAEPRPTARCRVGTSIPRRRCKSNRARG